MPVNTPSAAYIDNAEKWRDVRACIAGSKKIKEGGVAFLSMHNPSDQSRENKLKYEAYKENALFVNYTARTRNTLVGLAFAKDADIKLPSSIAYLEDDATGDGVSLEQVGKNGTGELLEVGNTGYLANYPIAEVGLTAEQVESMNLRANMKEYKAESILSWKTKTIGSDNVLVQIVLAEEVDKPVDEFSSEIEIQYRVLRLNNGIYTQQIYNEIEAITEEIQVRTFSGEAQTFIPFYFAGAYSNDPCIDDAPLYDIARVNIGHYRNSAEYENSIRMIGNPQAYLAGSFHGAPPENLLFGTSTAWVMQEGGQAGLIQVAPNTLAKEGMGAKEEQIVSIGARLVVAGGQAETAEAARLKFAGDTSVLQNITQNVSEAITKCLKACLLYMSPGSNQEVVFNVNEEFYTKTPDPQLIGQMIMLQDRGTIAQSDTRDYLRASGAIADSRTDEDIDAEAGLANPIG